MAFSRKAIKVFKSLVILHTRARIIDDFDSGSALDLSGELWPNGQHRDSDRAQEAEEQQELQQAPHHSRHLRPPAHPLLYSRKG